MQILTSSKYSCRKPGTDLRVFQNRTMFASMFNDITSWDSSKVQAKCPAQAEVAKYAARLKPGYRCFWSRITQRPTYWCFCCPGSEQTWKYDEYRPPHQFADGGWDHLALRMTSKLMISNTRFFKCSNILQSGVLVRRKKGGVGTHF